MHNEAKALAEWALGKAKACGYDNISSEDWCDLAKCMEVAKAAVCIDKDYRIVKGMDEAEESERYGYNSRRYPTSGRYASEGHGTRMGYRPYMEEDEYLNEYMKDPMEFRNNMRMGYTMPQMHTSKYGEAYDGWSHARRHYTDSHDAKSKEDMDKYTKEHMHRTVDTMMEMYKDAEPDLKMQMKQEVEKLMQQM